MSVGMTGTVHGSVDATKAARFMLASQSFDSLFKSARSGPIGRNVRFIKLDGHGARAT